MSQEIFTAIITAIGTIIGAAVSAIITAIIARKKTKKEIPIKKGPLCVLGAREELELSNPLDKRVNLGLGIREIRILNFASTSILSPHIVDYIGLPSQNDLSERIEKLISEENIKLTLIITSPGSYAANDALDNEKIANQNMDTQNRNQVFYQAYAGIQSRIHKKGSLYESYCNGRFKYRVTNVALPYGIFQVKYNDSTRDHIKIDLYSPYISRESKRRTFFIYKENDPENYHFFEENFDNLLKNAMPINEEKEYSEVWLEHAKELHRTTKGVDI